MPVRKKKSEGETVRTTSGGRKVSVVLPPDLAERVERLADVRGETLTKTVVRLVGAGEQAAHERVREDALAALRAELLATVETIGAGVRKEVQGQAHRLSHLLARTALESMAGRLTGGHALYKLYGSDQQKARELYSSAWTTAVERLKNPTPAVRESLNEIAAGAGSQEPGMLANLADAVRELQASLEVIETLSAEVQDLKTTEAGVTKNLAGVQHHLEKLSEAVVMVNGKVKSLQQTVQEASEKRRGLFG